MWVPTSVLHVCRPGFLGVWPSKCFSSLLSLSRQTAADSHKWLKKYVNQTTSFTFLQIWVQDSEIRISTDQSVCDPFAVTDFLNTICLLKRAISLNFSSSKKLPTFHYLKSSDDLLSSSAVLWLVTSPEKFRFKLHLSRAISLNEVALV